MANIGNAERCNGSAQLGIDLSGTEKQRHRYAGKETAWSGEEQLRFAQQRIGTELPGNESLRKGEALSSKAKARNGFD